MLMMYRSNWGRSQGQEVILAIRLRRTFFDSLLECAVPSSIDSALFDKHDDWRMAVDKSDVRLQWDPDHQPDGMKEERRAIQLGLRGDTLAAYGKREIVEIIDMNEFVASQREFSESERYSQLRTPVERPYRPTQESVAFWIGLASDPSANS